VSIEPRLKLLLACAPSWFAPEPASGLQLRGMAYVPGTVWSESGVRLLIEASMSLAVREAVPGTVFPARCPERHIQSDQTFCMGLRKILITDLESAGQWWEQLRQYIQCQSTAEQTGIWPPMHTLDHGDAGEHHERALQLAADLNLEDEYAAAYMDEASWITDQTLKLLDQEGRPINGRMPCPRGCRHARAHCGPVIRRKCRRRAALLELVRAERDRRRELAAYWRHVIGRGEVCCGRMRSCGLPRPSSYDEPSAANEDNAPKRLGEAS